MWVGIGGNKQLDQDEVVVRGTPSGRVCISRKAARGIYNVLD